MHEEDSEESLELKSKSQLKREAHALQDLGAELTRLPEEKLLQLELPDRLLEAVMLARKITKRGGLKRQMQFIGKLMRQIDAEPIQQKLEQLYQAQQANNAQFHQLERWRDRLVAEGDDALTDVLTALPHADRQHLRQLIRKAQKEEQTGKPAGAARSLFRYLRSLQENETE
jgi:ribosome-associated protein